MGRLRAVIITIKTAPEMPTLFPGKSLAVSTRLAAMAAVRDGIEPIEPPVAGMERVTVSLPMEATVILDAASKQHGLPPGKMLAALAYAWWRHCSQKPTPDETDSGNHADDIMATLRPLQASLYHGAVAQMREGKIVFAEGSTGIGKSRIIALAARELCERKASPVIIAAPSLAVLGQVAREWVTVTEADLHRPGVAVRLGRGQFVDPERLTDFLDAREDEIQPDVLASIRDWSANGGRHPAHRDGIAGGHWLDVLGVSLPWLLEDLLLVWPDGLGTHDIVLQQGTDEDNKAEQAYRMQREDEGASVIFCSHALLALHAKLRVVSGTSTLLPDARAVLIDEGHDFEGSMANAVGANLSVFSLQLELKHAEAILRKARLWTVAKRVIEIGRELLLRLSEYEPGSLDFIKGVREENAIWRHLQWFQSIIDAPLAKIADKTDGALSARLRGYLADTRRMADEYRVTLVLSPVRSYPSIYMGPRSVSRYLEPLWDSLECAALVSATLYTLNKNVWSAQYMRSALGVPTGRLGQLPPAIAPWLLTTPDVVQPRADDAGLFIPPSTDREGDQDDYYEAVANVIQRAAKDARGGVLVLLTSYYAIHRLADRLGGALDTRLMAQQRGEPMAPTMRRFRAATTPVWLATGAAWTGIDMADSERAAADDFLLTDLVIPRIPYQTRTSPQHARAQSMRNARNIEALFQFRQGIGRLVRREGVSHRRLWLLDGRLVTTDRKYQFTTAMMRRLLAQYSKHKTL